MLLFIVLTIALAWCLLSVVAVALCVTAARSDARSEADLTLDRIVRAENGAARGADSPRIAAAIR